MRTPLAPEVKSQLKARLSYYRDMGVQDFYRRPAEPGELESPPSPELLESAPVADNLADPPAPLSLARDTAAELQIIREDIGDCVRCKLAGLGRKNIVFGVGNPNAELMFVGEGPGA